MKNLRSAVLALALLTILVSGCAGKLSINNTDEETIAEGKKVAIVTDAGGDEKDRDLARGDRASVLTGTLSERIEAAKAKTKALAAAFAVFVKGAGWAGAALVVVLCVAVGIYVLSRAGTQPLRQLADVAVTLATPVLIVTLDNVPVGVGPSPAAVFRALTSGESIPVPQLALEGAQYATADIHKARAVASAAASAARGQVQATVVNSLLGLARDAMRPRQTALSAPAEAAEVTVIDAPEQREESS